MEHHDLSIRPIWSGLFLEIVACVRDPLSAVPPAISLYLSLSLILYVYCTIYLPLAAVPLPAQLNT